LDDYLVRVVDDGTNTLFWSDAWMKGGAFCGRFGRLSGLVENQLATVAEMYDLWWILKGESWK